MNAPSGCPDSIALLNTISREKASRSVRFRKLPVTDYKPSSVMPDKQIALSGTVTLFIARKGEKLFQELKAAVKKGGESEDRKVAAQLNRSFAARRPRPLEEIARGIRSEPLLADLRYGGATLVENIILPSDATILAVPLPYNGGRIAEAGFTLAEHYVEDLDEEYDVLLVRHEPPLTEAERAALKAVPEEMVAVNIGKGPGDAACSVVLLTVAVVAEVAVVAATFTVVKAHDDHSMDHVNPAAIKDLGPVASARALTNLRRDILQARTGSW